MYIYYLFILNIYLFIYSVILIVLLFVLLSFLENLDWCIISQIINLIKSIHIFFGSFALWNCTNNLELLLLPCFLDLFLTLFSSFNS